MPTRNVNLTEELDRFVFSRIESGRYESASEVVRAALRTLEREELEHEARVVAPSESSSLTSRSNTAPGRRVLIPWRGLHQRPHGRRNTVTQCHTGYRPRAP